MHFVFKWGFEVNPVSNNSRMLETEDFGDIPSACALEMGPVRKEMQGHPEKNGVSNFLCDQSKMYGIM